VERVKRVIWQCESEIILNAKEVDKDIGKLVAGASDCKLLVAGLPDRHDLQRWLDFIEWASAHMPGDFFLAVMDSYSIRSKTGHGRWNDRAVTIQLYHRQDGHLREAWREQ
jgi:hypothetical protein